MNLHEAAQRLEVHYQTAYRWVRTGTLPAVKVGSAYTVREEDISALQVTRSAPSPPPEVGRVRSWSFVGEHLQASLMRGDELRARQTVDRLLAAGIDPVKIVEELLVPALRVVGEGWAGGQVSVAQEHRASAICERLLARLAVHPRGRPRGVAVVATPPGEGHGLPASMATTALRADRWQVHHLGTEVPVADLVSLVTEVNARLVVLSLTNPAARPAARQAADALGGRGVVVLIGAPGLGLSTLIRMAR